ncbi:uncharacterized protein LOC124128709 isoform X2 [Haliotis rufescens]|uniref:uncharacterized protein LOC124128709 isoform X2 n=1 Tax=Haliotis rufescens TaxID=6454 RepID=UPI00201FB2AD|nr:uncharacterized protein LOC124128709 isoform X2 [Haliotis rufescens]
MFIDTLEFTIPVDLCNLYMTLQQQGTKSHLDFPASVNSYGTTQDANVQVALRANKVTFKVDGVSSNASIISKSECKTLKLSVFDVDRSLMPQKNTNNSSGISPIHQPQPVLNTAKRLHEQSVSLPLPPAKSSRTSFSESPRPRSPVHRRSQPQISPRPSLNTQSKSHQNDTPVNVKLEPEDPDLIEIEPDDIVPKKETPYMQIDYSLDVPHTQTSQAASERLSHQQSSHSQSPGSSSSSFHQNVPHAPDYAEPSTSQHVQGQYGDQSADEFLVFQDDNDYGDDNEADYSNDDDKDRIVPESPTSQSASTGRFATVEESELDSILLDGRAKSTQRTTLWGVNIFRQWLTQHDKSTEFEELPTEELSAHLRQFYAEVRTEDGQYYSKSSYIGLRAAIHRRLRSPPYDRNINILQDKEFHNANKVFMGVLGNIKKLGLDSVAHYEAISPEDLTRIREFQSINSPINLQRKVWFDITLGFGRRGCENQRDLTVHSFSIETDDEGVEFLTLRHTEAAKNPTEKVQGKPRIYATGSRSCPVAAFRKYCSKLNPQNSAFFQQPRKHAQELENVWYTLKAVGHNTLSQMMKGISTEYKLSKIYTNHCVRATTLTLLSHAGVDSRVIETMTGQRNQPTFFVYNTGSLFNQKRHYSAILHGCHSTNQ